MLYAPTSYASTSPCLYEYLGCYNEGDIYARGALIEGDFEMTRILFCSGSERGIYILAMNNWSSLFDTRLIIIAALRITKIFMYIENNLCGMGLTRVRLAVPLLRNL